MVQIRDEVKERRSDRSLRAEKRDRMKNSQEAKTSDEKAQLKETKPEHQASGETEDLVEVKLKTDNILGSEAGKLEDEKSDSTMSSQDGSSAEAGNLLSNALKEKARQMKATAKRLQERAFRSDLSFLIPFERSQPPVQVQVGPAEALNHAVEEDQASNSDDEFQQWFEAIPCWKSKPWIFMLLLTLIFAVCSSIIIVVSLEINLGSHNGTIVPVVPVPSGPVRKLSLRDFDCVYETFMCCFSDEAEACVSMKEHFGRRPSWIRVVVSNDCPMKYCDGYTCFKEI